MGDEASLNGFDLLVSTAVPGNPAEQQAYQRWIHGRRVDGVVLNRIHLNDWRVQYLAQSKFPFVTLVRASASTRYSSIEMDGSCWFRVIIDHLVSLGHQRIAYIGALLNLVIQSDRLRGYRDGLQRHGLTFNTNLVLSGDLTSQGGYNAGKLLLTSDEPPTAIACVDDMTAIGVLHAARDLGRTVGQDLAVTGFDGIDGSENTQPPLTTVNLSVYNIDRRLVQMLIALVTRKPPVENQLQIEHVLEIRQSTQGKQEMMDP